MTVCHVDRVRVDLTDIGVDVLLWNEIQRWQPSEITLLGARVARTADSLASTVGEIEAAVAQLEWSGDAADAAQFSVSHLIADYRAHADELGRLARAVTTFAKQAHPVRAALRECDSIGVEHRLEISDSGTVADPLTTYSVAAEDAFDHARDRLRVIRELEARARQVIRRATDIDVATAAALAADVDTAPDVLPTPTAAAAANNVSWQMASPAERTALLVRDPGAVGNLDGVPAEVRDAANRRLLISERARLESVADDLARTLVGNVFGGLFDDADVGLAQTEKRLKALDEIEAVLAEGNRQLLVLDNTSGEDTLAAVSVGNVSTATHVAVFVPGLDSDIGGDVGRYDSDMDVLASTVRSVLPPDESVACVTWMNYEAPHLGWNLLDPTRTVVSPMAAAVGAPRLAAFLDGLDASRTDDPHLTLLGHSYGSLTAALALRGVSGVDDLVALGSPGLGFDDISALSVPPGHTFVAEAREDIVADTGFFGSDPSELDGVRPLATRSDGGLSDSRGHSEYLTDGTVTQRNVGLVIAGRAGEVSG